MGKKQKRRHSQMPLGRRGPSLEEVLEEAEKLYNEEKFEEALQVLEEVPPYLQQRAELLTLKGFVLISLDRLREALTALETARRREPAFLTPLIALGPLYDELGYSAHALRTARLLMENREFFPPDVLKDSEELLNDLEDSFRQHAEEWGLSVDQAEEAIYLFESSLRALEENDFRSAVRFCQQASRIVPQWPFPKGMIADTLFMDGRIREAIQVAEKALADHPDFIPIRVSLVRYYFTLGDRERAEALVQPLKSRRLENYLDLAEVVKALGILEDDKAIYTLYRRYRSFVEEIDDPAALVILGSAAANMRHFATAESLFYRVMDLSQPLLVLHGLIEAARLKEPAPGINHRYPTLYLGWVLPYQDFNTIVEALYAWVDGEIDDRQLRKRFLSLMERYPQFLYALAQTLRPWRRAKIWIELLIALNTPEALDEIRQLISSQRGVFADRLMAAQSLARAGVIDPSQPLTLWDENRQEWRTLTVPIWKVKEVEPEPAIRWVERAVNALEEKQIDKAEEILREGLARFPNRPALYHIMAAAQEARGNLAEAEAYLHKALEADPKYTNAWVALSWLALKKGDREKARQSLDSIPEPKEFTPRGIVSYLRASANLALAAGDVSMARFSVESAVEWMSEEDDAPLSDLLFRISLMERTTTGRFVGEMRGRADRQRQAPIQANASLAECLNRITKDNLRGTCKAAGVSSVGRKEELIQRLAEALTDPDMLRKIVADLSDEERQALRDVLEAGGVFPWDDFVSRYGHDLDYVYYWDYSPPETLMGRLRFFGLLSDGTVEDRRVVLIPMEMRALLPPLLSPQNG